MKNIRVQRPERMIPFGFIFFFLFFLILIAGFFCLRPFFSKKQALPVELEDTVGKVELAVRQAGWVPVRFGRMLQAGYRLRTGPGEDLAELRIDGQARVRLKENSELQILPMRSSDSSSVQPLSLLKGTLLLWTGDSGEKKSIEVLVSGAAVRIQRGAALVQRDPKGKAWIGVLRGSAEISEGFGGAKKKTISSLNKAEITSGRLWGKDLKVSKISKEEWNRMKEAYELFQKGAAAEALQLDLSKEAGGFFEYVFDHGTFSTPRMGFADREFIKDVSTGEVHLEAEYDVFPAGSYVGVYMKCRNLDLSRFSGFKFKARRIEGASYPESVKIEFKSKFGIVRAYVLKFVRLNWEETVFPLNVKIPTLITEVTLLFTHEKAGIDKSGRIALKDFSLVPKNTTPSLAASQAGLPLPR